MSSTPPPLPHHRDRYLKKAIEFAKRGSTEPDPQEKIRCSHCGFEVTEEDRFPVIDPYDRRGKQLDYMRIPYANQNMHNPTPTVEDSDFVFCSDCCALAFMYDSSATGMKNQIPDRFYEYVSGRYGITDPVIRAPPAVCLSYLYAANIDTKSTEMIGLSKSTFYFVLSQLCMQITTKMAAEYVPPTPEEEQMLDNPNVYTKAIYQDGLPPNILETLPMPVQYDANADSDAECDFGMEQVFKKDK